MSLKTTDMLFIYAQIWFAASFGASTNFGKAVAICVGIVFASVATWKSWKEIKELKHEIKKMETMIELSKIQALQSKLNKGVPISKLE